MKKKICLFLSMIMMVALFTGCSLKEEEKSSSVNVKFGVDGYSMNQTSRAQLSIEDNLKEYAYFKITSVEANENTNACILQSWDTISNGAINLEQNVDYEISNETQNLISVYSNLTSIADNSFARCTVTVNFHN